MNNQFHIFVAAVNFQKLDKLSDKLLRETSINTSGDNLELMTDRLGFDTEQVAIIDKCNAVNLVITYFGDYDQSFIRGRVLSVWDEAARVGLANSYRHIKTYEDIDALNYLIECALGLNSVTVGDSQVLSQVSGALHEADTHQQGGFRFFPIIITAIKDLAVEAKSVTSLYKGNTSLERIAAEIIRESASSSSKVAVIGAGKTGSLIVKIISAEYGLKVLLANRTIEKRDALITKYPNITAVDYADFSEIAKASHIVNTLPSSDDTIKYISKLLTKIKNKTMIVDLSSPSIVNEIKLPSSIRLINVEKLSDIANERLTARRSDVAKVRALVRKRSIDCVKMINRELARYSVDKRKASTTIKLGDNALGLLRIRNECNRTIRKMYETKGFLEVITPYIVGVSSDPPKVDTSKAFSVDWPDGSVAFLRQSNQLYKQMIVASGTNKIFEIGPFWRLEEKTTYRHLLESIGLDVEFSNPKGLSDVYSLAYLTILAVEKSVIKSANIKKRTLALPPLSKVPILTYKECVGLLRAKGYDVKYGQDLGLIGESRLGQIIKKDRGSDALIIINYPDTIKKFYTMRRENGETETFDIIIDGWELVSGALRNTNREEIEKSMRLSGVNSAEYSFYISVVSNAVTHGGFCLGLDRAIAKSLGLEIVSEANPFPRTAETLIP